MEVKGMGSDSQAEGRAFESRSHVFLLCRNQFQKNFLWIMTKKKFQKKFLSQCYGKTFFLIMGFGGVRDCVKKKFLCWMCAKRKNRLRGCYVKRSHHARPALAPVV
jgi:hypothetical protein